MRLFRFEAEAEEHVFAVPHDVVGAPGVVEEIEVDAFVELRLFTGEVKRRLDAEGDEWGVLRDDGQFVGTVAAGDTAVDCVHVAIAALDDVEGRDLLAGFLHGPGFGIWEWRVETEPESFGHARRKFSEPGDSDFDRGRRFWQNEVDEDFCGPRGGWTDRRIRLGELIGAKFETRAEFVGFGGFGDFALS